jgi:hypothetical protein
MDKNMEEFCRALWENDNEEIEKVFYDNFDEKFAEDMKKLSEELYQQMSLKDKILIKLGHIKGNIIRFFRKE